MGYFGEFRSFWRRLATASLGIAFGYSINNYLNNIFIPPMMKEFGWTSAQIASLGTVAVFSIICQPLAGRITDKIGVRWVAAVGVSTGALLFLALSLMQGEFLHYYLITAAMIALFTSTTGPVVYSRLVAESFDKARGVALAIATSSYSISGAIAVPLISDYIAQEGWRAGYQLVAVLVAVVGMLTILFMPREQGPRAVLAKKQSKTPVRLKDVISAPAFKLILCGLFLSSITLMMQTTQLSVLLIRNGLSAKDAAFAISIYALGAIAGRVFCGAALDRFPTHIVAALAMGLPGVGLLILAIGSSTFVVSALAVLLLGMALGAEGDLAGFLAMSYFKIDIYSTVMGAFIGTVGLSAAVGALILTFMLGVTDSFGPFLLLSAFSAVVGSGFFWMLRTTPKISLSSDV